MALRTARRALGLERIELRALVGGEDGDELRLLGLVELPELGALRLHLRLQRIHLGLIAGLLGGLEVLVELAGLLEEGLVLFAEALLDRSEERRVGEECRSR